MSEFPNVDGQVPSTSGGGVVPPLSTDARKALIESQGAAFVASFQTAVPKVRLAAA
jgi:hypothetical protein